MSQWSQRERDGVEYVADVPEPVGLERDDPVWRVPWLDELLDVPDEASWPRYMTAPHPLAVGSLGVEAIDWLSREAGIECRWWQRLVLVRQLEHDADGRLVWPEVLLSTSRQSGKSTALRAGAMWRIHQADRFGEPQTLLHTGKDLPVCKEVQRLARMWAKQRDYPVREQNGNEEITEPSSGSRWIVRGKGSVYGYSGSAGLVDEAWGVQPEVVDDGLEPTQLERKSPQLLLASTAHRKATSTFVVRRAAAAAALDEPGDVLLVEWSAQRDSSIEDRAAWRMASPHWSPGRERLLEKRLARVLAGKSVDVDEDDPVESFRAQYLNIWPATLTSGRGDELLAERSWIGARCDADSVGALTLGIEDHYGTGAALAACGLLADGRWVLGGLLCEDRGDAYRRARRVLDLRAGSQIVVGSALAGDPELDGLGTVHRAVLGDTQSGCSMLRALIHDGRLCHDNSPQLSEQVLTARVSASRTGLTVVSTARSDLLRAALWALVKMVRQPSAMPAFHVPQLSKL